MTTVRIPLQVGDCFLAPVLPVWEFFDLVLLTREFADDKKEEQNKVSSVEEKEEQNKVSAVEEKAGPAEEAVAMPCMDRLREELSCAVRASHRSICLVCHLRM
jgi:hypothetical protein